MEFEAATFKAMVDDAKEEELDSASKKSAKLNDVKKIST